MVYACFIQVSLIDLEGSTLLYERHFASELSAGIISLQFETCSLHGFDKNVVIVATKDSSVTALETETGNLLNVNAIQPKKPSRALFMQICGNSFSFFFLHFFFLVCVVVIVVCSSSGSIKIN